jgi:hypothetical protein
MTSSTNSRRPRGGLFYFLLSATLLLTSSSLPACNALRFGAATLTGDESIPALHELDATTKSIALVLEDEQMRSGSRITMDRIGATFDQALLKRLPSMKVIDSRAGMDVILAERSGKKSTMKEIGEKLSVETLVFAQITSFGMSDDGVSGAPTASVRVKVIDVATGNRLFPKRDAVQEWHAIMVAGKRLGQKPIPGSQGELAATDELAEKLGLMLASVISKTPADEVYKLK